MTRLAALLAGLLIGIPAHAQLYKWVDKNGVLNYTDSPPDAKQNAVEKLPDRISSYQVDPVTRAAAAQRGPSYYEAQLEREWAQRQRLMAAADAMPVAYDDPRFAGYATPYGPAVIVARPLRPAAFRPLTRPPRSRPLLLR